MFTRNVYRPRDRPTGKRDYYISPIYYVSGGIITGCISKLAELVIKMLTKFGAECERIAQIRQRQLKTFTNDRAFTLVCMDNKLGCNMFAMYMLSNFCAD